MKEDFMATWPEQAGLGNAGNTGDAPARAPANQGLKQIVTIRLDVDMLNWFKSAGPGYQTRINQILRDHMDAQRDGGSAG